MSVYGVRFSLCAIISALIYINGRAKLKSYLPPSTAGVRMCVSTVNNVPSGCLLEGTFFSCVRCTCRIPPRGAAGHQTWWRGREAWKKKRRGRIRWAERTGRGMKRCGARRIRWRIRRDIAVSTDIVECSMYSSEFVHHHILKLNPKQSRFASFTADIYEFCFLDRH
jgi:hypothetical protein